MEEMLQEFLADNVAKDNLAQQSDASQQNTQAKATQASKQNDAEKFFLNLLIKIPALAKVIAVKMRKISSMPSLLKSRLKSH